MLSHKAEIIDRGYLKTPALTDGEASFVKLACARKLAAEGRVQYTDGLTLTMTLPYEEPGITYLVNAAHRMLHDFGFDDVRFWSARLINKPPGEQERSYHQDWHWWTEDVAYRMSPPQLGVMVYLQDTKKENGALRVIPGAHRDPSRIKSLYTQAQGVQDDEVTVDCIPNDFVVIDARIPHATHVNNSDNDRSMITMWFIPAFEALPRVLQEHFFTTREYTIPGTPPLAGPLLGGSLPAFSHEYIKE